MKTPVDWPFGEDFAALWARVPSGWSGISVGPGWADIVLEADAALAKLNPDYEINQVKEKYGQLCFYCSLDADPAAREVIRAAEARARSTCERCGSEGPDVRNLRSPSKWYRTLCNSCRRLDR